ncbi:MAG: hypothetical protein ACE10C_14960, partial [Candidatus Binatia bacterium]
ALSAAEWENSSESKPAVMDEAGSKALSAERNQLAVSSRQPAAIRTTDYETAGIKESNPPPPFSKIRFAYC